MLLKFDRVLTKARPLFVGMGQLGLVALGVHLAADRLDDHVFQLLVQANDALSPLYARLSLTGIEADALIGPSAWVALGLELVVDAVLFLALGLTPQHPELSWSSYKRTLGVKAVVVPLTWIPLVLAGAWSVAMALEDVLSAWHAQGAQWLAGGIAALVVWRLGWSGWCRVVGGLSVPKSKWTGLAAAPLLLLVAGLAARYGLPVWGWLS